MTWLVLVVLSLATYRVTRAIAVDEVAEPLRMALARRFPPSTYPLQRRETGHEIPETATVVPSWPVRLVYCEWCLSVWVSAALVLGAHYAGLVGPWRWVGFAWPAVAALSGAVTNWVSSK